MNLEILFFVLYLLSFVFLALSLAFLISYRIFQNIKLRKGVNSYLIGLCLFSLFVLIKTLFYGQNLVQKILPSFYINFSNLIDYLIIFSDLILVILINLFYLASVILFNDMKLKEKKNEKN